VAKLQWSGGESSPNSLSAILQGLQEEVLQGELQRPRPHPSRQMSPLLGGEAWTQEAKESGRLDSIRSRNLRVFLEAGDGV